MNLGFYVIGELGNINEILEFHIHNRYSNWTRPTPVRTLLRKATIGLI